MEIVPRNDCSAGSILSRRAFLDPDKEAVVCGSKRITYGRLEERTNRLANACLALGVQPGDRVAVMMSNCTEYLEIVLAMAKIRAVAVLVNVRLSYEEVAFILNDCEATILFCNERCMSIADAVAPIVRGLKRCITVYGSDGVEGYERLIQAGSDVSPDLAVQSDDPLMIIYTAGTTGRPKGAVITHGNSLYSSLNSILSTPVSRWRPLVAGPLFHVAAINASAVPCILIGGTQVLLETFEAEQALRWIERERCTFLSGVPLFAKGMLEKQREKNYDISTLECLIIGGAPMSRELFVGWKQYGVDLIELYGMTETTSGTSVCSEANLCVEERGVVGKPMFFTNLRVLDGDGRDVGCGEVGEIVLEGGSVIKDYWNREGDDGSSFKDGWFYTGDLGRFDESGVLHLVDRRKDMIKSGGENVYAAEVELAMMEHESVDAVAVVGVPDPHWDEVVCAAVVLKKEAHLQEVELTEFCRERMARYKVPKKVRLVEDLPRNAMGKVLKNEVRKVFVREQ